MVGELEAARTAEVGDAEQPGPVPEWKDDSTSQCPRGDSNRQSWAIDHTRTPEWGSGPAVSSLGHQRGFDVNDGAADTHRKRVQMLGFVGPMPSDDG
jgi:hypothetical protein